MTKTNKAFEKLVYLSDELERAWKSDFLKILTKLCVESSTDDLYWFYANHLFAALVMFIQSGHALLFGRLRNGVDAAVHELFVHSQRKGSYDGLHVVKDKDLPLTMVCVDYFRSLPDREIQV